MTAHANVFLTAEWRDLLLLNYEVEPELLRRYVPRGTELDCFQGKTYVSLVGFRFLATRLRGKLAIPFHTDFAEINLRFYVRREMQGEIRRGVVFIAEIVPRLAIAATARLLYGENYVSRTMKYWIDRETKSLQYGWKLILRASRPFPRKAHCNNSSSSTTGAIRLKEKAAPWNTAWSMCPGDSGRAQKQISLGIPVVCMGRSFPRHCGSRRIRRLSRKVRRSASTPAQESPDAFRRRCPATSLP